MLGATTGLKMSEKSSNVLKTLSQIPKSGLLGGNSVKKRRGVSRLCTKPYIVKSYSVVVFCATYFRHMELLKFKIGVG